MEELHVHRDKENELERVTQTLFAQMKIPKNNAIKKDGPMDIQAYEMKTPCVRSWPKKKKKPTTKQLGSS